MTITWMGHACFLLEQDGYRIVTDPYTGVPGYPALNVQAHAAFCSHGHFDHNYLDGVTLLPQRESPFTVEETASFHDGERGALRGANTIRVFSAGGVRVCHLGDLGHRLSGRQLADIGKVDALMIPVGGTYTVDAAEAKVVCDAVDPKIVLPMHYRHAPYGLETVSGVEPFLALWPKAAVELLTGNAFELPRREMARSGPSVLVMHYPA